MSKLGDLIVRLRLDHKDYEKGLKKSGKETQGFANTLGKIKGVGLAVFSALGAGMAVFANEFATHTNAIGDKWTHTMTAMKASYHSVIAEMSNYKPDFSSFGNFFKNEFSWIRRAFGNAKDAGKAAAEMSAAFDAEFELVNSVKLQRQQVQQELNELYIRMRDTTLPAADRKAAGEKYKALLQPIADAEVRVYGNMLNKAVAAWQAGNELDREYSVAEMTEFFSKIGTEYEKMQQKFPDLMRVYETRKGDAQNIIIFDTLAKLQEAANQMSEIDRILSRSMLSINKQLASEVKAPAVKLEGLPSLSAISGQAMTAEVGIGADKYFEEQMAKGEEFMAWYMTMIQRTAAMNQMLEDSIIQATAGSMQAFTDMLVGIEGADASNILAALLQPFAQTATQLGSLLLAEGLGIKAFKESLKSLNPAVAISAGVALIALGSALGSAIKALGGGGGGSVSNGGYSGGGAPSNPQYNGALTVHIKGKLKGTDIVMSEDNTKEKLAR